MLYFFWLDSCNLRLILHFNDLYPPPFPLGQVSDPDPSNYHNFCQLYDAFARCRHHSIALRPERTTPWLGLTTSIRPPTLQKRTSSTSGNDGDHLYRHPPIMLENHRLCGGNEREIEVRRGADTGASRSEFSKKGKKYDLQLVEPRVKYTASNSVYIADEQEGTLSGPFHGSSYYG